MAFSNPYIENEAAYEAAKWARIKANRQKGAFKKWLAQHEDGQRLHDWLEGNGEFAPVVARDERCVEILDSTDTHVAYVEHWEGGAPRYEQCKCHMAYNPVAKFANSSFLSDLREQIREWGNLSEKQTQAVRDSLARAEGLIVKRNEEREQQIEADRAGSKHVGTVGERIELTLTCERNFSYNTQYGTTYVNICRDADGNVIVYKGTNEFQRGGTYTGKATIKAHEDRDGVAQTLIARPSFK